MTRLLLTPAIALSFAATAAPAMAADMQAAAVQETTSATVPAESYEARLTRARDLATSGQREQALQIYGEMLAQSPGNGDVLVARGRTYAWMQRYPEAEADLLAVTNKSPQYADAWSALGDMYLWSGRPNEAAAAYTRYLELKPDDSAAVIARGRAHRAAGDLAAAREDFTAAGTQGADPAQVEDLLASLSPRVENPEAVVPEGYRWSLRFSAGHTDFNGDRESWGDYTVALRHHFDAGSLAVEWLDVDRFNDHDQAWALDGYFDLWSRAYTNVRYQQAPSADLFPEHAWRVELFQGVGDGWELSASYDRLEFSSDVEFYSVGVGRYVGNFYLRGLARYVPDEVGHSTGYRGLVRYYYSGDGDNYVEVSGGTARGTEEVRGQPGLTAVSSSSAGVAWVMYPTPRWGFKLGVGYADEDFGPSSTDVSASLYLRW